MTGRKRKFVPDLKEVAAYRQKLRRPAGSPLKLTNREKKKFTIKAPFPQRFSIPSNILRYVVRNPSCPIVHLKLISTCKSLFRMSRIVPVRKLGHNTDNQHDDNDRNKWLANGKFINLQNQSCKLWLHHKLSIWTASSPNLASSLVNHVYKCSLQKLVMSNQVLSFGELQILVSGNKLNRAFFYENVIENSDGTLCEFEKVLELLCCKRLVFEFHPEQHGIGKQTATKIAQILASEQTPAELRICLTNLPQTFDFNSFAKFLKENMTGRQHTIHVDFAAGISDEYKNQLQQFVEEVIQLRGIYAHTVPIISFPGHIDDSYDELWKMRDGLVQGILQQPN